MESTLRQKITAKLSAIKKVLAEEVPVAMEDAKLIDGTIVRIEPAIEVGATIKVIADDGELIEAPDGDHELESGDVIKVVGGVITELIIVDAPKMEEEMAEEAVAPVVPKLDIEALQNQLIEKLNTSISDKINSLKFASTKEVEALRKENKTLRESMTDLVDIVQKFAGTPVDEPIKKVHNPFADKQTKTFDFSKIRQSLKN